ncbi:hypothetical protein Tco_0817623, partial [Tanacetum coccineum]
MDRPENSRKEYRKRQADADANVKSKEKNKWKVGENVVDKIRKSSNKYFVLDSLPEDNDQELIMLKERMIVDKYLNEKVQPTLQESILWSKDMIEYFKKRWERDRIKENTPTDMEDVLEANDGIANVMKSKEVNGIKGENEVMNLVKSEDLKVCAVLETRLKGKKLGKACDRIFQKWNLDAKSYNFKCFFTFVYVANDGLEMRDLWEELIRDCRYVNGKPCCIAGDIN